MRHLFWYLTGFGILLAGVLWGSEFRLFIDMPSLVIVLGGAIVFTLTHHRPGAIVKAVKSALGKHTGSDLSNHYQVLQNLRRITMVCGVSGGIIGLATVIRYANPASAKLMGPGMAVAILSMLYGLILSELLVGPLCAKLKSRGLPT